MVIMVLALPLNTIVLSQAMDEVVISFELNKHCICSPGGVAGEGQKEEPDCLLGDGEREDLHRRDANPPHAGPGHEGQEGRLPV